MISKSHRNSNQLKYSCIKLFLTIIFRSLKIHTTWRIKIQLLTYVVFLPSSIWSTQPKVTFVWTHKKRCFGSSDNKLVWIPPQILAQYPEKGKIHKILGMAWLSIKMITRWQKIKWNKDITWYVHHFSPSCENQLSKKQKNYTIKTPGHDSIATKLLKIKTLMGISVMTLAITSDKSLSQL